MVCIFLFLYFPKYAPIFGAFILELLIEVLIPFGQIHTVLYATLLIIIIFRNPQEIIGIIKHKIVRNVRRSKILKKNDRWE